MITAPSFPGASPAGAGRGRFEEGAGLIDDGGGRTEPTLADLFTIDDVGGKSDLLAFLDFEGGAYKLKVILVASILKIPLLKASAAIA